MLKDKKSKLIGSLVANPDLAEDIKQEIEVVKTGIAEAEQVATKLKTLSGTLMSS